MGMSLERSINLQYNFVNMFLILYLPPVLLWLQLHFHMFFLPFEDMGILASLMLDFSLRVKSWKWKNRSGFALAAYISIFK